MNKRKTFWHRTLKRPIKLTRVIDVGKGGQAVLLIHGLAGDSKSWLPFVKRADTRRFRVIAFDLLGFGQSEKPEWSSYDLDEHVKSLKASLGRDKKTKLTIVGHSMGCLIAARFANKHPKLVDRLILYEPPLFIDNPDFPKHGRRRNTYFALYRTLTKYPALAISYSKLMSRFARFIYTFTVNEKTWIAFERSMQNVILEQQSYLDLQNLIIPTDIIYGRFDIIVSSKEIDKVFIRKPNITLHKVADTHGISARSSNYILKLLSRPIVAQISRD